MSQGFFVLCPAASYRVLLETSSLKQVYDRTGKDETMHMKALEKVWECPKFQGPRVNAKQLGSS